MFGDDGVLPSPGVVERPGRPQQCASDSEWPVVVCYCYCYCTEYRNRGGWWVVDNDACRLVTCRLAGLEGARQI